MIKSGPGGCLVTCPQHKLSSFGSASISSHDDGQNHAEDDDLNYAGDDEEDDDDDDDDDDGGDEGRFLGKHLFSTCWHFFVFCLYFGHLLHSIHGNPCFHKFAPSIKELLSHLKILMMMMSTSARFKQ